VTIVQSLVIFAAGFTAAMLVAFLILGGNDD